MINHCAFSISAPLLSVPLFGGSATIEWITLSSSGVFVSDSQGKMPRILQGNDNTIPRWVRNKQGVLCFLLVCQYTCSKFN